MGRNQGPHTDSGKICLPNFPLNPRQRRATLDNVEQSQQPQSNPRKRREILGNLVNDLRFPGLLQVCQDCSTFSRIIYVLTKVLVRFHTFYLRFLGCQRLDYVSQGRKKNVEHPSNFRKFENARIYSCDDKNVAILGIARVQLGYLRFSTFSRIMD